MDVLQKIRHQFQQASQLIFSELQSDEKLLLSLNGEYTDYIRFNENKVRQNTYVEEIKITLEFQKEKKSVSITKNFLIEESFLNIELAKNWIQQLRTLATVTPEDPYLVQFKNYGQSYIHHPGQLKSIEILMNEIHQSAHGLDLAGLYAGGFQIRASKNSLGQDHWFSSENFYMDFSLYHGPLAVKGSYAGNMWDSQEWSRVLNENAEQLELMKRPVRTVSPGKYNVYLAPAAVNEIFTMFNWNGLSFNSYKRGSSGFKKFIDGEVGLSDKFSLIENFNLGLCPPFNSLGEIPATKLPMIEKGLMKNLPTSSRSALEFGVASNFADSSESLRSPEILGGGLTRENILKELGTGLFITQLHYMSWSDVMSARFTGMTRYACFWCEDGKIVAPIKDLRFDESIFSIFGKNLIDITDFQEIIPLIDTYFHRALGGKKLPGLLVRDFTFTL